MPSILAGYLYNWMQVPRCERHTGRALLRDLVVWGVQHLDKKITMALPLTCRSFGYRLQAATDKEFACAWTTPARRLNFEFCFGDAPRQGGNKCSRTSKLKSTPSPTNPHAACGWRVFVASDHTYPPRMPRCAVKHRSSGGGYLWQAITSTRPECPEYSNY